MSQRDRHYDRWAKPDATMHPGARTSGNRETDALRWHRGPSGRSWPLSGRFTRFIVSCATLVVRRLR